MGGVLGCLATNLVCCFSSAACHCFSQNFKPKSSVATRVAYAVLFLITSIFAWTMQTGWIDHLLAKIPKYPYDIYDCPTGNCFSGNFAVARVLFSLSVFHALFGLLMIKVKNSKDFRAGIQNGWWGPKFLLLCALIVVSFLIPDTFFHTYSAIAFGGAILFLLIQLVLLIDFAAKWSESWVGKWENTESKGWLALLIGAGIILSLFVLAGTIVLYVFFGHKGCKLNIFFITFNLIFSIAAYALSVSKPVQEARPSSGILQAGVIAFYALYLLTSALSDETSKEGEPVCNPFAEGGRDASTALGTIFTFVAIAYSTTRAASNSKVLMGANQTPETVFAGGEDRVPLITEAPAPLTMENPHPTPSPQVPSTTPNPTPANPTPAQPTDPKAATPTPNNEQPQSQSQSQSQSQTPAPESGTPKQKDQQMIEMGIAPDTKNRKQRLEEAVASGSLPKSALEEESSHGDDESDEEDLEDKEKSTLSKEDERKGCVYNYSFYHVIFAVAAMYVTMLINRWSTVNIDSGELVSVGHDWVTVWIKIVISWVAYLLYGWTLVAPVIFPDRDFS